jgi:hypothetical protein
MTKTVQIKVNAVVVDYRTDDYLWCDVDCPMFEFKKITNGYTPFCRFVGRVLDEDNLGILRAEKCLKAGQ